MAYLKSFYMRLYLCQRECLHRLNPLLIQPELKVYITDFGKKQDDIGLVAEVDKEAVGAVWVRIMNDYGHIDNETPSFAISVHEDYRGLGIGTALMKEMLRILNEKGYKQASLAVQKANYASTNV